MARRFTSDEWQQRLNKIKQPLVIIDKHKDDKKEIFKLQCYKCGGIFDADRNSLSAAIIAREKHKKNSNWCPYCNNTRILKGVNDIATIRKDLVVYFADKNDTIECGQGSGERALLICPICRQTKTLRVADLCSYGFHCDYCDDNVSLGEKIIRNLILQLPIKEYDFEFTDSWTQNKRYDVYFSFLNTKYLIEIDGEQHIKDTSWSTQKQQQENDMLKTRLASQNGYKLIRIKAYHTDFDYIKQNILNSELAEIFDLSNVDWIEICKQTVTNRNIEMAKYYTEHDNIMIKDIAKHFHVSVPTVIHTLKKLSKVGLCDYSREKVFANGRKRYAENLVKDNIPFKVYYNDKCLGEFKSARNCCETFEDLFKSIKLSRRQLNDLLYKGESYKGYSFIYEISLYDFHKDKHPILFRICEMFNDGMNVKEISNVLNINTSTVYKNLIAGTNMKICNYQKRNDRKVDK